MNIKSIVAAAIFVVLVSRYAIGAPSHLDKIVAVVNNDVITQSELNNKIAIIRKQLGPNSNISVKPAEVLDSLVDIAIQLQLAKRSGIQVDEKELDGAIANIAKNNNITVDQLKSSVVEHDNVSFKEFRNQIREQILISRVQQQFLGKELVVTDKDVADVLRNPPKMSVAPVQHHIVDVVFAAPDNFTQEQQRQVAEVAKSMAVKLKKGISVDEIVKDGQKSFGEVPVVSSNDLGWRKLDEMPNLFASEVANMAINQVVGPIKAPNGFHLIKLLGVNGAPLNSAKLTKDQAREIAFRRKLSDKLKPWLKEQRAVAYIKIT